MQVLLLKVTNRNNSDKTMVGKMNLTIRIAILLICLNGMHGAEISTILGTGELGFSGDDGKATEARINGPFGDRSKKGIRRGWWYGNRSFAE